MSKSHKQSTPAHVQSVANTLGVSVAKLMRFTALARAYVQMYGKTAFVAFVEK